MSLVGELVVAAVIFIGLCGVVLPVLPGLILILAAIGVWAFVVGGWAWLVFAVAAGFLGAAALVKYLVANKSMKNSGVPGRTVIAGGLLGIVGFFVIPVVGLIIGFVLGAFLAEWYRNKSIEAGWRGAVAATKAAGIAMIIELAGALFAASIWLGAAFVY
ncbi:hypothetical protein BH683_015405 [Williamsia sp. 1138]|uniref:DUF456 domain-containing protein n=1 Tax=Gordonia rubripertincta TaxID=36822 RepID=A0ABT4MYJ5_GORRU|nr:MULTISPECIES: DUF456 domain-containing protein [Mycobacteriales]MCZ4552075.1 DUF456 domain-containing protein [Gordonia rubripertincta]OZG28050.1 hypothetical protein BH683_015405 [Williamsia sp. 1138]